METPRWSLKGIRRIFLKPDEETRVAFGLTPSQMALVDEEGRCILEPGFFNVYVGGIQPDERSRALSCGNILTAAVEGMGDRLEIKS